jgi:hypothetical protein
MDTLTIKLPVEMKNRLETEAAQSGKSVSALIRESVSAYLRVAGGETSLYERTRDLCGAGASGVADLATDPRHLERFGE